MTASITPVDATEAAAVGKRETEFSATRYVRERVVTSRLVKKGEGFTSVTMFCRSSSAVPDQQ